MEKKTFSKMYIFFIAFLLVSGITFSFLIPLHQIPDEGTHLKNLTNAAGIEGFYEQYFDLITITNIVPDVIQQHGPMTKEKNDIVMEAKLDKSQIHYKMPSPMIIKYLPGAIGIGIGILFGLPIFWCMMLGKFFSLAFATCVCTKALKLMPVKKELFMATLLIPVAVQQYASINYDSILLPVIAFYFAYIMHFLYEDTKFRLKDMLISLLCLIVIAIVKLPYVLVGILFFMIPGDKLDIRIIRWQMSDLYKLARKRWYIVAPVVLLITGLLLYMTRKVFLVSLVLTALSHINYYAHLVINSFADWFRDYFYGAVGNFGWLDGVMPLAIIIMIYVFLILFSLKKENEDVKDIGTKHRILIVAYMVILGNLIFISMIRHTFIINDVNLDEISVKSAVLSLYSILGVQGRYFIPFLVTTGMLIKPVIKMGKNKWIILQGVYYVMIFAASVITLVNRYWC